MKKYISCVLLLLALGCSKSTDTPSETAPCGIERWSIKNLTDGDVATIDWSSPMSSIAAQDSFPRITVGDTTARLAFEKQTVSIPCTIVAFVREDDSDIHLILTDASQDSMIAEVPNVSCAENAASSRAPAFMVAYQWVLDNVGKPTTTFKKVSVPATVSGVLFQDFPHGQKGHALNYREIHPVLGISK